MIEKLDEKAPWTIKSSDLINKVNEIIDTVNEHRDILVKRSPSYAYKEIDNGEKNG